MDEMQYLISFLLLRVEKRLIHYSYEKVEPFIIWGIERSGFFNGREKWAKGFENQRV